MGTGLSRLNWEPLQVRGRNFLRESLRDLSLGLSFLTFNQFIVQCVLYYYADDNTFCYTHTDFTILKSILENESNILISWFSENLIKANPDKFQAICVGKKPHENIKYFQIGQTNNTCKENVTLFGINIDFMLMFDSHVSAICKKASKQLAV